MDTKQKILSIYDQLPREAKEKFLDFIQHLEEREKSQTPDQVLEDDPVKYSEKKEDPTERSLLNRITRKERICHGKPTVREMRYPVSDLLELMASDMTIKEILEDYPDLEREDLTACLLYAAQLVDNGAIASVDK